MTLRGERNIDGQLPPEVLQQSATLMAMLAATVRLHILWLLTIEDRDVTTLATLTDQSTPTVSHHLSKLKLSGIVNDRRSGRQRIYFITNERVSDIVRLAVESSDMWPQTAKRRTKFA
ncbi:metalloregulator ArsR/SmtB family transcription factor [Mycobacterium sp. DL592]|uniref:ArsR/SmtB family transcription factor n=1 Tax=Mycobacterium sp. DL592 TaxID=2675524 RepID=UPI001FB9A641|nr:metalloregulator ArsR/SmtB family transcription factor [Mycobacterium sp. DL592]